MSRRIPQIVAYCILYMKIQCVTHCILYTLLMLALPILWSIGTTKKYTRTSRQGSLQHCWEAIQFVKIVKIYECLPISTRINLFVLQ